jgi:hypothetical protein
VLERGRGLGLLIIVDVLKARTSLDLDMARVVRWTCDFDIISTTDGHLPSAFPDTITVI